MTKYNTGSGREVDMDALILKHEHVRAVGNMNVDAAGNVLDSNNATIATRTQQVNKHYAKQVNKKAHHIPVVSSKKAALEQEELAKAEILNGFDDVKLVEKAAPKISKQDVENTGGLAGAIAKAREVKQEPTKSPREKERSKKGVNKI